MTLLILSGTGEGRRIAAELHSQGIDLIASLAGETRNPKDQIVPLRIGGFGGEEGYIHEKFRKNGGRSLCVPGFKWLHRFGRPDGAPYPLKLEDRIWNYYIGWGELQGPDGKMLEEITDFFKNRIPMPRLNQIRRKAAEAIEKQNSQK